MSFERRDGDGGMGRHSFTEKETPLVWEEFDLPRGDGSGGGATVCDEFFLPPPGWSRLLLLLLLLLLMSSLRIGHTLLLLL